MSCPLINVSIIFPVKFASWFSLAVPGTTASSVSAFKKKQKTMTGVFIGIGIRRD